MQIGKWLQGFHQVREHDLFFERTDCLKLLMVPRINSNSTGSRFAKLTEWQLVREEMEDQPLRRPAAARFHSDRLSAIMHVDFIAA